MMSLIPFCGSNNKAVNGGTESSTDFIKKIFICVPEDKQKSYRFGKA